MAEKIIMSREQIRRTLARIAHEIIEQNQNVERLVLVGMHTRGVPLARRLAANIGYFEKIIVPVGALDISPYRDDISSLDQPPTVHHTEIPSDIDGKSIVLVDDVLYTGRSVRAAMDALTDFGRPQSVQLAVFVDRGHREMPIRADYIGKNIPSSRHEDIQVRLVETDGKDEIAITDNTDGKLRNSELSKLSQAKGGFHDTGK